MAGMCQICKNVKAHPSLGGKFCRKHPEIRVLYATKAVTDWVNTIEARLNQVAHAKTVINGPIFVNCTFSVTHVNVSVAKQVQLSLGRSRDCKPLMTPEQNQRLRRERTKLISNQRRQELLKSRRESLFKN